MDLYMNTKSQLADGRLCLTFLRPGPSKPGGLLQLVEEELPWDHVAKSSLPISRVVVYTSKDETMTLHMFVYGDEKIVDDPSHDHYTKIGSQILDVAERIQRGELIHDPLYPKPAKYFEREPLLEYMKKCSFSYLSHLSQSNPRRFLNQRKMFAEVSGTENMSLSVEEVSFTFYFILLYYFYYYSLLRSLLYTSQIPLYTPKRNFQIHTKIRLRLLIVVLAVTIKDIFGLT